MQFFATLLAFATAVSANNYTLYCGDSCNTGSPINTGINYGGASCTNLINPEAFCYLTADVTWYKAVLSRESGCIGTNGAEQVITPGQCFEGPWQSYQVAADV